MRRRMRAQRARGRRCRCARRRPRRAPAAIGCSASSAMPSVVLPEPDSPTMPSVSPRRSSSVALPHRVETAPARTSPARIVKSTSTPRRLHQHRRVGADRLHHTLAAGSPAAAACTACCGCGEHARRSRPISTSAPALHHADPVGEAAHQVQVVRDEQQRHAHLGLQLVEQREDLRLDGHVERGRRLVGRSAACGLQASAIAIIARWRWPPESWCG